MKVIDIDRYEFECLQTWSQWAEATSTEGVLLAYLLAALDRDGRVALTVRKP